MIGVIQCRLLYTQQLNLSLNLTSNVIKKTMKKINLILAVFLVLVFLSCNNDDDSTTNPPEPTLNELRDETTIVLTSTGTSKTWRIDQATLTNGNSEIDISQNFNVVDDEFIFSGTTENGILEWRKGYDIKTNASDNQETLIDKYVSSIVTSFSYQDESSKIVEASFGSCTFEIKANNTLNTTITNNDNTVYNFTLVEKTEADYASASTVGLNFIPAFTFESNSIGTAPGMIGSYADNSFFIVTREDVLNDGNGAPERILKFDIATNSVTENLFFQPDFVSKQLHIIDDQLIVIGGQNINTYDLNLNGDPSTVNHGKFLSRFGMSALNNDAYIIGGDLNDIDSNKIFKWSIDTQTLSEFATLPESKSGARGSIVNDNLFIFGGSEAYYGDTPTNTIYKVNIENPSTIETFQMNQTIDFTFVQKFQNLIYVAGQILVKDGSGTIIGRDSTIGVFNTSDNSFVELATNLTNDSDFDTIHQMCVFNDKMYIVYGNEGTDNGGQFNEWEVLVSDLN